MSAFCNNLRDGDPVLDVESKRPAKVVGQPRESSVNVKVLFQGTNTPRYVPLAQLRLVVDGKPEDCAPHDGELPPDVTPVPIPPHSIAGLDARDVIKEQRDRLKTKMDAMNKEFVGYREQVERLDAALVALG